MICSLLEKHGQGGPCCEDKPDACYYNSFIIADGKEAWILETSGKHWAAEKITGTGVVSVLRYTLSHVREVEIQGICSGGSRGAAGAPPKGPNSFILAYKFFETLVANPCFARNVWGRGTEILQFWTKCMCKVKIHISCEKAIICC